MQTSNSKKTASCDYELASCAISGLECGNGVMHAPRKEQSAGTGTAGGPCAGGSISDGICGSAGAGQRLPPTPPSGYQCSRERTG